MQTLTDLFLENSQKYPKDKNVFYTKEDDSSYSSIDFKTFTENISSLIHFFNFHNLKKGDKVAILSDNRHEWAAVDFACMFAGLVSVPSYVSLNPDQIKYILNDAEVKIIFVMNKFMLDKIKKVRGEVPSLKTVVSFNDLPDEYISIDVINYTTIRKNFSKSEDLKKLSSEINEEDLLTIIYTSGTTGNPKGVMLSHKNIYTNIKACMQVLLINERDRFLSFLPFCHAYERTAGYYLALFSGAEIYFAKNIDTISAQMPEAKPTILICVPRLLEKMHAKIIDSPNTVSGFKKKISSWAINMALERKVRPHSFKWNIAHKLVYTKITAKTGGALRLMCSGGGALNKNISEFFIYMGVTVIEGYGMTEHSPVISVNPPDRNKPGTVGPSLNGVKAKIADDGEILIQSESVMAGYYKHPEDTSKTIVNCWLHTGDIGEMDSDGYIKITDRKKELFKSSGGKYIAPAQIEEMLKQLNYIEQVLIIGNERMFVTSLIVPQIEHLKELARKLKVDYKEETELHKNKEILKEIEKDINSVQKSLATYEKVRRFALLEKPFTIEDNELTPTMKIKRRIVEEKYKDVIEKMYKNS
ncbi:MAG: long-chain fatty acid--CoA ligase [Ignavibacteria bacterium]|nr:long-chain fatty acid--CoA ligase [Ignavibacteria bacterium]